MKSIKILFLALLIIGGTSTIQAQAKLGHISYVELLALMPETKAIDAQLEQFAGELQSEYDRYLQEYQGKVQDFQQNAETWSETKREAVAEDIQLLESRIQEFQVTSQDKLGQKRETLLAPILEKVNLAVEAIGKEQAFTYILDSSNLVYVGENATDVMSMVKTKLNL